jgi:hypothetical protein
MQDSEAIEKRLLRSADDLRAACNKNLRHEKEEGACITSPFFLNNVFF